MREDIYIISRKDLIDLFARLSEGYDLFVPYRKVAVSSHDRNKIERLHFGRFNPQKEAEMELGDIRQSEPLKSFINPSREKVFNDPKQDLKPMIIAGVKACDLKSLKLQDFVFQGTDPDDPAYSDRRRNTVIISHDCTCAKETCFCLAVEGVPYPETGFDLNLTPLEGSFLVEIGSDKGRLIVERYRMFFRGHSADDLAAREAVRRRVCDEVKHLMHARGMPDASSVKGSVKKNFNNMPLWQDLSSTCVECGACNLVCPTCHCFLLFDERFSDKAARFRIWDSCLYRTFARVAGGANPRKHLYERLRNRFDKKFDFFPHVLGYFACTGCGRCIEACPGDIDIREAMKGLVNGSWNKPPHR
jgi:ferredoxin